MSIASHNGSKRYGLKKQAVYGITEANRRKPFAFCGFWIQQEVVLVGAASLLYAMRYYNVIYKTEKRLHILSMGDAMLII